ncbi:MAG: PEGA domain-containing protein [Niameybacter sp.]|uniref:PEGA domain-containing protein n=1 Tax=Niameybacter sp. TaxID=2033640 RepID=UPI002FC8DCA9
MKRNKIFVKSMIISSIIGFTAILAMMFVGIKYFVKETVTITPAVTTPKPQTEDNEFYMTSTGVVRAIKEGQIDILDLEKKEVITYEVKAITKIQDTKENEMPYSQLKVGSIVEVVYQPVKDNLVCIRLAKESFTKVDMKGLGIDRSNRTITIGSQVYYYTGHTHIMDEEGNLINMHEVGDYDTLTLTGIEDKVYAIQVEARAGYVYLGELPAYEGYLEIGGNRQIPLSKEMKTVPLTAQQHQITLHLEGYEPITTTATIKSGETLDLNFEDFESVQTNLVGQLQE